MSDQFHKDNKQVVRESSRNLQRLLEASSSELEQPHENSVPDILRAIREHLKMEVAFVAEFTNGQRVFRYVDSSWTSTPIRVGGANPLEDSFCQRVVDGRLPELINNAQTHPATSQLEVTFAVPVGAHMSVPIQLSDGSIYGTFCCFSRSADLSLNLRDLNFMRVFAELAAKMIERDRITYRSLHDAHRRIHEVLRGDVLYIVYQPIFDLVNAEITGFEALSRFGTDSMQSTDLWFRDAHLVNLGVELEMKAVEIATQAIPWLNPCLDLAINVSPETILDQRFQQMLTGMERVSHLVLEITEHASVDRYEEIALQLKPYRDKGLQIAVDDAGAGYASFRHILNLEPDRIKLDMSLTRDIDSDPARRALAAALVHFAYDTGSMLVAEGVETSTEAATLMELGVKKAQGFFLGRPMPLASLEANGWLSTTMQG